MTGLCLLGIVAALYLLDRDLAAPRSISSGSPIGLMRRADERVRRKASSSLLWGHITGGDTLYRRDSIKVGPRSAATLELNGENGAMTTLELGENSFVILDDVKNMQLRFVTGNFIVRDETGDRQVSIDDTGRQTEKKLGARLSLPSADAVVFAATGAAHAGVSEMKFTWERSEGTDGELTLEIAPARGRGETRRISAGTASELTIPLAPGEYRWRLYAGKEAITEARRVRILAASAPTPLWPTLGQVIPVWGKAALRFRWAPGASGESADSIGEYFLEIASDAEFAKKVFTERVYRGAGAATLTALPEGELFWRLTAKFPGVTLESETLRFATKKQELPPFRLLEPAPDGTVERRPRIAFRWLLDSHPGGDSTADYRWELAPDKDDATPLFDTRLSAPEAVWDSVQLGKYKWRVAFLSNGETLGVSAWQRFSVVEPAPIGLKTPTENENIRYWNEPTRIVFEWDKATDSSMRYRLVIGKQADLKDARNIASTDAKLASDAMRLEPGEYFWRVDVLDEANRQVKTSPTWKFSYAQHPLPAAPKVDPDASPTSITLGDNATRAELRWETVSEAKGYELTMKSGDKVVFQTMTKDYRIKVPELRAGKYDWHVRSIDQMNRRGPASTEQPLQINYGKRLRAPEADVEVE